MVYVMWCRAKKSKKLTSVLYLVQLWFSACSKWKKHVLCIKTHALILLKISNTRYFFTIISHINKYSHALACFHSWYDEVSWKDSCFRIFTSSSWWYWSWLHLVTCSNILSYAVFLCNHVTVTWSNHLVILLPRHHHAIIKCNNLIHNTSSSLSI